MTVCKPPVGDCGHRSVAHGQSGRSPRSRLLVAVGDASSSEVVRSELHLDFVTGQDANVVTTHLSGDVSQNGVTILELNPEHCVREGLDDGAFQHDCIFF